MVTFGVTGGSLNTIAAAMRFETLVLNFAINQASEILVAIGNDKKS